MHENIIIQNGEAFCKTHGRMDIYSADTDRYHCFVCRVSITSAELSIASDTLKKPADEAEAFDGLVAHISELNYDGLKYDEILQVIQMIEEKVILYDGRSKKLKSEKEKIKEIVRERMVKEDLPGVDTEHGRFAPKQTDCILMKNFNAFLNWLQEGVLLDLMSHVPENEASRLDAIIAVYNVNEKPNDRLYLLKQACFDTTKLKAMYKDPDDTLPPGIGVYEKHDLSIIRPKKKK